MRTPADEPMPISWTGVPIPRHPACPMHPDTDTDLDTQVSAPADGDDSAQPRTTFDPEAAA